MFCCCGTNNIYVKDKNNVNIQRENHEKYKLINNYAYTAWFSHWQAV